MNMQEAQKWIVPTLLTLIFILMIFAGPLVLGGILMGLMATLAVWLTIKKLPAMVMNWIGKHPFIADLIFLKLSFMVFALLGSGVMVFVALMTQAVALGLLLQTLNKKAKHGNDQHTSTYHAAA